MMMMMMMCLFKYGLTIACLSSASYCTAMPHNTSTSSFHPIILALIIIS